MNGTPVPTPAFGWSVNGQSVLGGTSGQTSTVQASSQVSGTSQVVGLVGQSAVTAYGSSEYTVTLFPGATTMLTILAGVGLFLLIRWVVKSIPFM